MASAAPLMPKATAVWLLDNTALSFDQIAEFCKLHPLEVKAIADGDSAQGIKGLDPVATGQLTCPAVGKLYVVEVTLTNGLKASQVATLPPYVSGNAVFGVPVGSARTQVTVYGSTGVEFGNAFTGAGDPEPVKFVADGPQNAAQYFTELKPGQSSTIRLLFNAKKGQSGASAVDVTPQVNHVSVSTKHFECGTVLK